MAARPGRLCTSNDGKDHGPWSAKFKLDLLKLMISNKEDWSSTDRQDQRDFFDIVASQAKTKLNRVLDAENIRARVHLTLCGPRRNAQFKTDPKTETEVKVDEWNAIVDSSPSAGTSTKKLQRFDYHSIEALIQASVNCIEGARDILLNPSSSPAQWQDAEVRVAIPLVIAARDDNKSHFMSDRQRNEILSWTRSTHRTSLFNLIPANSQWQPRPSESSAPQTQVPRNQPEKVEGLSRHFIDFPIRQVQETRPARGPTPPPDIVDLTSEPSWPTPTDIPLSRSRPQQQGQPRQVAQDSSTLRPHGATASSYPRRRSSQQPVPAGQARPDDSSDSDSSSSSDSNVGRPNLIKNKSLSGKQLPSAPASKPNSTFLPSPSTPTMFPQNKRKAPFDLSPVYTKKYKVCEKVEEPKHAIDQKVRDEVLDRNMALGAHKKTVGQPSNRKNNKHSGGHGGNATMNKRKLRNNRWRKKKQAT